MENEVIKVTARCPIRTTLELIGGKWKLLIVFQLAAKPLRLSELKRLIPDVSEKMLIQELKNLIDSKLAVRKNFGEVPSRVEYELTPIAHKLIPLIHEMKRFAASYEKERLTINIEIETGLTEKK
ncbi:MAG: helix-turn-helix transcriptional regulator [Saprospirales bacterium]|nr:helix-turn-helix transcriptional regulator [Saprospirales bacterium]